MFGRGIGGVTRAERQGKRRAMDEARRRRSRLLLAAGLAGLAVAGGAVWLWSERTPIATSYIDDSLRTSGVPASYRLAHVGLRTHRIERIRIGDPRHPDLTADWAEIELAVGLTGVSVRAVDAGGVHLRGRLVDGKLSLGTIGRLLPPTSTGQPFALPDIRLTARTIGLDLTTPQGLVRATLDGKGNLHDDFSGRLRVASGGLAAGGCAILAPVADLALAVEAGRPLVRGPVEASSVTCPDVRLVAPRMAVDARGDADLARWRGDIGLQRGRFAAAQADIGRLGGRISFDASARQVSGKADLHADRVRHAAGTVGRVGLVGSYRLDPATRRIAVDGDLKLSQARLNAVLADRVARLPAMADGTPIGPILAAWARAVRQAGRSVDGTARFALEHAPEGGALRVERVDAAAFGGGRLSIRAERTGGLGWRWPVAGPVVNGSLELAGGGLPHVSVSLRQAAPGAPLEGSATIAPYRAGDALLRLAPLRFGPGRQGATTIATHMTLDGPLADGRIDGLDLPVAAAIGRNGGFAVNATCARLSFSRLAIAGTVIANARLPLCPIGGALAGRRAGGTLYGGASIAAPRLRGRVGDQPLTMAARSLAVGLGRPGFSLDTLAIRLGDPASPTTLDVATLGGAVGAKGFSGRFDGASGKIGAVPLLVSGGSGDWRLASSELVLGGAVKVDDAERTSPRFHQLVANDVRLTLKSGRIGATATFREPRSSAAVARVAIRHDLSSGAGDALLDVADLRFGKALQPEAVTPLTLGMIANVEGTVTGQGRIRWSGGNVTSDGDFRTQKLDFAAAFGPVSGLKGSIHFTDLLGLVTAPDQQVTIAEINPGIAVNDGTIRYRLLPDRMLAVAGGAWPFAGGTLTLEPSILDMGQPVARRLTFRIAGLDAATFVQQLEFKNIAVTGKFDGVLPIVFDARGGRIENGALTVRPGGGTLSYVGDVTNADLGRIARIAFDALKSMRYDRLTIDLNGDLDGEIVSKVRFDGTNDKPEQTARSGGIVGRLLAPVTRLPFRFNITITAPFRGLVNSAQTFVDPSIVLRNATSGAVEAAPVQPTPIQPR